MIRIKMIVGLLFIFGMFLFFLYNYPREIVESIQVEKEHEEFPSRPIFDKEIINISTSEDEEKYEYTGRINVPNGFMDQYLLDNIDNSPENFMILPDMIEFPKDSSQFATTEENEKVTNWIDDNGNNILHIMASSMEAFQYTKFLDAIYRENPDLLYETNYLNIYPLQVACIHKDVIYAEFFAKHMDFSNIETVFYTSSREIYYIVEKYGARIFLDEKIK